MLRARVRTLTVLVATMALLAVSGVAAASAVARPAGATGVPATGTHTTYDWGNARYGSDP
jgi:hypothetical protein